MRTLNKSTQGLIAGFTLLGLSAAVQAANGSADFTLDGAQVTAANINIETGVEKSLRYNGGDSTCTDVEWYLRKPGETDWGEAFDSDQVATLEKLFRSGTYELKMTARGFNGAWFWGLIGCNNTGQFNERLVGLNVATPGYTQTKHPIMLVPGVLGYDDILGAEYFYRVADEIRETSDQPVGDVSLSAWQNTEDRGADLANKIVDFLMYHDPHFGTEQSTMKVNLIAHSHGATTSRMAINILAKEFGENAKVASLTTVAGPHYGTPTADGANWAMENWGTTGKLLGDYLIDALIGDIAGMAVALASGHANEYGEQEIIQVLEGFTQKGMARFNACYPSAGVQGGGSYFIEDPLPGNDPLIDLPIENGEISISDCYGNSEVVTAPITIANEPDLAYGAETVAKSDPSYGDGLGQVVSANDPKAVRYYSFTGVGEWNTSFGNNNLYDPADAALLVINSLYALPGERTEEGYFWTWLGDTGADLINGDAVSREIGYSKDSDAFIPVSSTHFGEFIGTFGPWNHVDEQNGLLGWVNPNADDPLDVYRDHANRLQQGGL